VTPEFNDFINRKKKCMKKVMLSLMFMVAVVFSFAAESMVPDLLTTAGSDVQVVTPIVPAETGSDSECKITQRASATVYFFQLEVTCTVTKPTCKEATREALACITEAINAMKEVVLNLK
jgi:hypothetical protein